MGSSTRPSGGAAAPRGGISQGGSFHYLNAQKRILREYAKNHLGLGVRWRSSLRGVESYRGVCLDMTPSSQWTQVSPAKNREKRCPPGRFLIL